MAEELNLVLLILELAAIILDFIVGIILARKTITVGVGAIRKYYFGITSFFFAHGIYMLTHVISVLINYGLPSYLGILIVTCSIVLLVAAIEFAIIKKTRHFFTIFGIVAVIIMVIDSIFKFTFPIWSLTQWAQIFADPILVVFIAWVYLNAARKATGLARKNAILLLIAIIMFALGETRGSPIVIQYIPFAEYIGMILTDVAIVMLYYGFMHLSIWKREGQE